LSSLLRHRESISPVEMEAIADAVGDSGSEFNR